MSAETLATTRGIKLTDTFNVRDLGGYPVADGEHVRWRQLLRGAGLHRLSDEDAALMRVLGLQTVIDLRTRGEIRAGGAVAAGRVGAHVLELPMLAKTWRLEDLDASAPAEQFLVPRYRAMLDEGAETIATTVRLLGDRANLPAIFFCAAGKDRTGVLAAVILAALGVGTSDAVADYLLSKVPLEQIRARAQLRAAADPDLPASAMADQPPSYMQAPSAAMEQLLQLVETEFGGIAGYLRSIGITGAERTALAAALVAPG